MLQYKHRLLFPSWLSKNGFKLKPVVKYDQCLFMQSVYAKTDILINWYSGMLSTINHSKYTMLARECTQHRAGRVCHLYSLYLVGNINAHFNNPFHSITPKILKHLKCSLQGDCECLDPYHMNPRSIQGTLGTVRFYCCSSACYRRRSVTDTLLRSYFCYLCHQGLVSCMSGVPICVHAVAVFEPSIQL